MEDACCSWFLFGREVVATEDSWRYSMLLDCVHVSTRPGNPLALGSGKIWTSRNVPTRNASDQVDVHRTLLATETDRNHEGIMLNG
jgi:hypothetical protein